MPSLHTRATRLAPAACALGLLLAACSGSSTPAASHSAAPLTPSPSSASPSTAGEPATGNGAIAAIKSNWAEFFSAKTPIARRLALLQNGQAFAAVIRAQASSPLALAATSRVTKVTLTGTDQAAVTYEILVSGKVALPGQAGVAVYQDGVWKVGDASFCALLKLQNGGKASGLPPGCPH